MKSLQPGLGMEMPRRNELKQHHKPRLLNLLRSIGIDVIYRRGEGDRLYYRDVQEREVEVLDLVGGYGSLLLGHSHPAIVAEAQKFLLSGTPTHVQGSVHEGAGHLSRELSRRANGDYVVVFANSGAGAVEAAMKHAMLETGCQTFLALQGAFHGKTLGAVQLNGNKKHRESFELTGLNVIRIRLNDVEDLESAFARADDLAGFIFEPVQGEGGVWPVEPAFAQQAAKLCAERHVPLIADECQTGLGRTGNFLGCEALGVQPDYVILSKALGGGLAKISAVLIQRQRYVEAFDLSHTSTYADDDYSCAIALKTLEIIDGKTLAGCREKGERLRSGLRELMAKYPGVISDVRGLGLMIGVEFLKFTCSRSFVLRFLSCQQDLLYILTGYLFNVHKIRVAPTLSDPFTFRLQPSAFIRDAEIDHLLDAMDDVCERLSTDDAVGLTEYLVDRGGDACDEPTSKKLMQTDWEFVVYDSPKFRQRERNEPVARVAWLCHMIDADGLSALEPAFGDFDFEKRQKYLDHFGQHANPVVMNAVDVRSQTGETVRLYSILLPVTSHWIKRRIDARKPRFVQALVQRGVDTARSLGCSMVSLGQYTSVVTHNGRSVDSYDMGLTTGNSYAIALVIQAIRRAQAERGRDPAESVLAVVGAAGNIGATCAEILAPHYRKTILVGNNSPHSGVRLMKLQERIPSSGAQFDLTAIDSADVVIAAMNSVDAPLRAAHFAKNAIVCDVSVPPSVRIDTATLRPDLTLIKGGIVRLPYGEDLKFVGFPLPAGQVYGCMAEGILFGFEGLRDSSFTGSLNPNQVRRIEVIAKRHGFELADYKTSCVLGSEPNEELKLGAFKYTI